MSTRPLASILATVLTVALLAPSAFLVAPQRAHAIPVVVVGDAVGWVQETITAVATGISAIADPITTLATVAKQVNDYVLAPIAFIKSGLLLKALTAGVIAFVTKPNANGTGSTQFVQNLQENQRKVGDAKAFAFIAQFGRNSTSPFASSISSSLQRNYVQNTSAAGFLAANRNTLNLASPNVNGFLNGDWSQGGARAWFALTTEPQNNPYTLYQSSQSQLANLVAGATAARLAELNWGQGFLSWCGPERPGSDGANIDETTGAYVSGGPGTAPGDPCTNKDGTPGTIRTPASTITAGLNHALGGGQDKLVQIGNIGTQFGQLLGSIATIMGTINLAKDVLGGRGSGGLIDAGSSPAFQAGSSAGVESAVLQGAAASTATLVSSASNRVNQYKTAWNTVAASADVASTNVTDLADFCTAAAQAASADPAFASTARAQASAARAALASGVAPVLTQVSAASTVAATATANLQRVQAATNTLGADVLELQSAPPTPADIASATQEAQSTGQATASPSGSLVVSGGTLVDRMNLISTNAQALKISVCTPFGGGGGGP
ncbi:hypothetical protein HY972_00840 [Candidatus Kaiserbacteria bacterium]|nr:hypothetical protein [Candidatus Kaiserbacteria bacterium]